MSVPPGVAGTIDWIAPAGELTVEDTVARIGDATIALAHYWPVRLARPARERLRADVPLLTGQRALDLFFPIARGSSAAVPGGFGTGKTVLLQQIAKWCDADVIVYVGCGERGNEMADVLEEMAHLDDPRTGRALLDRTVLIANTSNMPVLAREASIYTGVTVAELYRDMGYDTVLIADSTSRWAEALREVASRTGELPAEEGYPAGLATALAAFYERSGRMRTLAGDDASVTILGAVSPPGGDMTEPVSAHTRRFARCIWSLDPDLAYARHYPAVSWRDSSSRDAERIAEWHVAGHEPLWGARREQALRLLAEADHLESVAQLVGATSLPDAERIALLTGRLLREVVLRQSSLSPNDATCSPAKQDSLLRLVLDVRDCCLGLVARGVPAAKIEQVDLSVAIRARDTTLPDDAAGVEAIGVQALALLGGDRMSFSAPIEYETATSIKGPLLIVEAVRDVGWDEVVEVRLVSGEIRHGVVLEVDRDLAVVQVFEGTSGMSLDGTRVAFQGSPMRIAVGEAWLGRVCNGRGAPLDGGPPVRGADLREVGGRTINPAYRATPSDPILTGVSVVDGLVTLVRGQKLPIFSVGGLPHLELAAQIAAQATVQGEPFAVVFAAMGVTNADARAVRDRLETRATNDDLVVFLNTADDALVERIVTPRLALTVAEHLAFDLGRHVLVVMADMTSYCEAVREVASSRGEIPSRRGYPGYLYSDLASLYERAGRMHGKPGSVTQIPVLTMPGEDITHPVPDLTGYITEGQVVLTHDLHVRGVYPPFDPLRSLSRLMRLGAGEGKTRSDHLELSAQLYALVAQARRVADLAEVVGADALSEGEARYLGFAEAFEAGFVQQGADESRSLDETLDRGWEVASVMPRAALTMVSEASLAARYREGHDVPQGATG